MSKLKSIYTWLCLGWSIPAIIYTAFQPANVNEVYYWGTVIALVICVIWNVAEVN